MRPLSSSRTGAWPRRSAARYSDSMAGIDVVLERRAAGRPAPVGFGDFDTDSAVRGALDPMNGQQARARGGPRRARARSAAAWPTARAACARASARASNSARRAGLVDAAVERRGPAGTAGRRRAAVPPAPPAPRDRPATAGSRRRRSRVAGARSRLSRRRRAELHVGHRPRLASGAEVAQHARRGRRGRQSRRRSATRLASDGRAAATTDSPPLKLMPISAAWRSGASAASIGKPGARVLDRRR